MGARFRISRRLLMLLAGAALLAITFTLWITTSANPTPPTYKGKTVTAWVVTFQHGMIDPEVVNAFGPAASDELTAILLGSRSASKGIWRLAPEAIRRKFNAHRPESFPQARTAAAFWLQGLGPDARSAIPELVKHVKRTPALLGPISHIAPEDRLARTAMKAALATPKTQGTAALFVPGWGPSGGEFLPLLTNHLARTNPTDLPYNQIVALTGMGPAASNAVPLLALHLRTRAIGSALAAFQSLGRAAAPALHELCAVLTNSDVGVRTKAAHCLVQLGPDVAPAVNRLRQLQRTDDSLFQLLLTCAIAQADNSYAEAHRKIAQAIASGNVTDTNEHLLIVYDDGVIQQRSSTTLQMPAAALYLVAEPPFASPSLIEPVRAKLNDPNVEVRTFARRALWRITRDPNLCWPLLAEMLESKKTVFADIPLDPDRALQHAWALQTLAEMPLPRDAIPALTAFFNNPRTPWRHRRAVHRLIAALEPGAAENFKMIPDGATGPVPKGNSQ